MTDHNTTPQPPSEGPAEVEFYVALGGEPGQEPTLIGRGTFEEVGKAIEVGRAIDETAEHPAGEIVSPGIRHAFGQLSEGIAETAQAGLDRYEAAVQKARDSQLRAIRAATFMSFEHFTGFLPARTVPHSAQTKIPELKEIDDMLDERSADNAHYLDRVTNAGRLHMEANRIESITLLHTKLGDLAVGELMEEIMAKAKAVYAEAHGGHVPPEHPDKGIYRQFLVGHYVRLLRGYATAIHPDKPESDS